MVNPISASDDYHGSDADTVESTSYSIDEQRAEVIYTFIENKISSHQWNTKQIEKVIVALRQMKKVRPKNADIFDAVIERIQSYYGEDTEYDVYSDDFTKSIEKLINAIDTTMTDEEIYQDIVMAIDKRHEEVWGYSSFNSDMRKKNMSDILVRYQKDAKITPSLRIVFDRLLKYVATIKDSPDSSNLLNTLRDKISYSSYDSDDASDFSSVVETVVPIVGPFVLGNNLVTMTDSFVSLSSVGLDAKTDYAARGDSAVALSDLATLPTSEYRLMKVTIQRVRNNLPSQESSHFQTIVVDSGDTVHAAIASYSFSNAIKGKKVFYFLLDANIQNYTVSLIDDSNYSHKIIYTKTSTQ